MEKGCQEKQRKGVSGWETHIFFRCTSIEQRNIGIHKDHVERLGKMEPESR